MLKTIQLPVHSIAHGRAGDKGDVSNVSLIAYNKFGWKNIQKNATEDKLVTEILKNRIYIYSDLKIMNDICQLKKICICLNLEN